MQMHLMYVLRHFVIFQHLILFSGWLHIKYLVFFFYVKHHLEALSLSMVKASLVLGEGN